jgi:hypothetical protein
VPRTHSYILTLNDSRTIQYSTDDFPDGLKRRKWSAHYLLTIWGAKKSLQRLDIELRPNWYDARRVDLAGGIRIRGNIMLMG